MMVMEQSISSQNKKNLFKLISGSYEAQGYRKTMEDTHKRIDDLKSAGFDSKYSTAAYYAVYDGHGGAQTAEVVVDSLHPKIFTSKLFEDGQIVGAIYQGFQQMDQYLVEEANKDNSMHGCTCVCSLVLDNEVYFANIGDSEGLLISVENGTVTPQNMTKAHKANDPSEKERIESMGGHVFFGRVYGSLAVSRSFGDAKYKRPKTSKDFVSWEPFTITEKLSPNHKYMVLACDGLFDVMTHQEVADYTHQLFSEGHDASSVAKSMVLKAINDLSTDDNVTVIIVKIDWENESGNAPVNEPVKEQVKDQVKEQANEPVNEQTTAPHSLSPTESTTSSTPVEHSTTHTEQLQNQQNE